MYNPAHFAETRTSVLHAFIRSHPLGVVITNGPDFPEATTLPMFLDATGLLRCHMARSNPHLKHLGAKGHALVIFAGTDHYISPNWYPGKQEDGKAVPTWNYITVHAIGTTRLFEDAPSLLNHLHELTDSQEERFAEPWSVADAPAEYIANLSKAIAYGPKTGSL